MKQAVPYLTFNGNANDALQYYKEVFEGEILNLSTFAEADYPTPPEADARIMHAQFKKDDLLFMVSDTFPGGNIQAGNNISLVLELESEDEIHAVYSSLVERGTAFMELQDTFWGAKYAKVKDAYGVIWDLNYTKSK